MALPKFIQIIGNIWKEITFINISTGAPDAEKAVATNAQGYIDDSFISPNISAKESSIATASEALTEGCAVNEWTDAGVKKVRKADASNQAKQMTGFVTANYINGATDVRIYKSGINVYLSGLTPDSDLFLSASVPGGLTSTAPDAPNNWQAVGRAISPTEANIYIQKPIVRV